MAKRKQISKKVRFEVFKRDGFKCQYCGANPIGSPLHVDHIHPIKLGGTNDIDNLVTSCAPCNLGKSATPLSSIPESLSSKSKRIKEHEEQINEYQKIVEGKMERLKNEAWSVALIFMDGFNADGIRTDWLASIKTFNKRLGVHVVADAMDIAISNKNTGTACFMYFCGICWNKIRELDDNG